MINTPVRAIGRDIVDADNVVLATCKSPQIAMALATFINAAAGQR